MQAHPFRRCRQAKAWCVPQIRQIADSILAFGFTNPILLGKNRTIVAGHGRVRAAKLFGITSVPRILLEHLTPDQIRAYVLADSKLALNAGWDKSILAIDFQHLLMIQPDFEITITGFEVPEIDLLVYDVAGLPAKEDDAELPSTDAAVSRIGDICLGIIVSCVAIPCSINPLRLF